MPTRAYELKSHLHPISEVRLNLDLNLHPFILNLLLDCCNGSRCTNR